MQPDCLESTPGSQRSAAAHSPVCRRTGLTAVFALLIVVWWLAGVPALLHRPFWMDEVHTWLLVNDADAGRSLQALADGVDYNPPGYFLLARISRLFAVENREFVLRSLSAVLMLSAAGAVYLLSLERCGQVAAVTAALMFGGHALILQQLTEVRFYAAWTASLAWLCVLFQRFAEEDFESRKRNERQRSMGHALTRYAGVVTIILLTCFISTCHYFGIISIGLVVVTQWTIARTQFSRKLLGAMLLAGTIATVGCYPFLAGQRQALTRPTWVSPPTPASSLEFLDATVPWKSSGILLLTIFGIRRLRRAPVGSLKDSAKSASTIGLGLLLLPLVLVVFSWVIQPALVPRYATAGMIGFALVSAALISQLPRKLQWVVGSFALICNFDNSLNCVGAWQQFAAAQNQLISDIDALPKRTLVLFEDRTMWLPLVHRRPDLRNRCLLLDFDDRQLAVDSSLRVVQRDVGRKITAWYPEFGMRHLTTLAELPEFQLVTYQGGSDRDLLYPPVHLMRRVNKLMFYSHRSQRAAQRQTLQPQDAIFFGKKF